MVDVSFCENSFRCSDTDRGEDHDSVESGKSQSGAEEGRRDLITNYKGMILFIIVFLWIVSKAFVNNDKKRLFNALNVDINVIKATRILALRST